MNRYNVEFTDIAETELIASITWGIEVWGAEATFRWARGFRDIVRQQLAAFPLGQPVAPESEYVDGEIRQLILGRYRVLFEIVEGTVLILHIRGPYTEADPF